MFPDAPEDLMYLKALIQENLMVLFPNDEMNIVLCEEIPNRYFVCVIRNCAEDNTVIFRAGGGNGFEVPLLYILNETMARLGQRYALPAQNAQ